MFASKISVSMLLAVQLSFMLIPETSSLVPSNQRHYARNATLENSPNLPRNKTSTPTKNRSIQRPVSKHAPASDQHKSYIVLLNDQVIVLDFVSALQKSWKSGSGSSLSENRIGYVYKEMGFNGFSAQLDDQAFKSLSRSAGVQEIIPDSLVSVNPIDEVLSDALSTAGLGVEPAHNATVHEQGIPDHYSQKGTAPWGLQRLDQRQKITIRGANSGAVNYDYYYSQPAGEGVIVYILDTGARETHNDFGGRVEMAAQFGGYDMDDGNGHGTHCAGIVAGNRWELPKEPKSRRSKFLLTMEVAPLRKLLLPKKNPYLPTLYRAELTGFPPCSRIGLVGSAARRGYPPTVVSLSLGGEKNTALDRAVQAAISQGIHFVVAAGNSNTDACLASPAAVSGAKQSGILRQLGNLRRLFRSRNRHHFSLVYGDDATKRIMATPHVAGLIAAHLSRQNYTTQQMSDKLKRDATRDAIYLGPVDSDPSSTPNLLLKWR
ncbi:hypothetical protein PSHT_01605 [Puccinia striiformis]|uniref:Peptidase S8/S53 domain-containing protein n=1 Tax=Puccinia striiformis TaxID=27350 RepID=A0A2S4WK47_9BASI|nr:hypothetical protein PSHT_01605 [Puccinia striiformis]